MTTVQIANAPSQFARQIAFTDDPNGATVRVQIVDRPELADLALVDDANAEPNGCAIDDITRLVAIGPGIPGEPLVYLSREDGADYRIYVVSDRTSLQQAAALIVAARGGHHRITAAAP